MDWTSAPPKPKSVVVTTTRTVNETIVYYICLVTWNNGPSWTIEKRFSDFARLHELLGNYSSSLPQLPPKTWMRCVEPAFIEERRILLNTYLEELLALPYVVTSKAWLNFTQSTQNITPYPQYPHTPLQIKACQESSFGVNQMVYLDEEKVLITCNEDASELLKWDAYFANITLPWETRRPESKIAVSSIHVWQVDEKNNWQSMIENRFTVSASSVAWDPVRRHVIVGMENGWINFYMLDRKLSSLALQHELSAHNGRVMALCFSPERDMLLSCGTDKRLVAYDVKTNAVICQGECGDAWLSSLAFDHRTGFAFVGTYAGLVYIYDVNVTGAPQRKHTLDGHSGSVRSLHYAINQRYLFSGSFDRQVHVWSIAAAHEVERSRAIGFLMNGPNKKIKAIAYCPKLRQVVSGHDSGMLAVWSFEDGTLLHACKAHQSDILSLTWIDEPSILISAAKDGVIKFWKFFPPMVASVADAPVVEVKKETIRRGPAPVPQRAPPPTSLPSSSSLNPFAELDTNPFSTSLDLDAALDSVTAQLTDDTEPGTVPVPEAAHDVDTPKTTEEADAQADAQADEEQSVEQADAPVEGEGDEPPASLVDVDLF